MAMYEHRVSLHEHINTDEGPTTNEHFSLSNGVVKRNMIIEPLSMCDGSLRSTMLSTPF